MPKKKPSPAAQAKALLAKDFILVPRQPNPKPPKVVQPPAEYFQLHIDPILESYDT
jgi:hypothetical protein